MLSGDNIFVQKNFTIKETLGVDDEQKTSFLLLEDDSHKQAVMVLSQKPFPRGNNAMHEVLSKSSWQMISKNNIYDVYKVYPPSGLIDFSTTMIYPCTEKHVEKYRDQARYIVRETGEEYRNITLPFIEADHFSIEWIDNIFNHVSESERILYEDIDSQNGFILINDMNWDGESVENLYVVALVRRKNLRSIRDLDATSLTMLENIREKSFKKIEDVYGLNIHKIKAYFHYQPSYYHLHVHFVNVSYQPPGGEVMKAIPLDDVIENIKLCSDYYKKVTLSFVLKANDKLLDHFRTAQGW